LREFACLIDQRSFGAYIRALAAFGAKALNESYFRFWRNTFGIAAPPAFEAASLSKDYRSYARPVMD